MTTMLHWLYTVLQCCCKWFWGFICKGGENKKGTNESNLHEQQSQEETGISKEKSENYSSLRSRSKPFGKQNEVKTNCHDSRTHSALVKNSATTGILVNRYKTDNQTSVAVSENLNGDTKFPAEIGKCLNTKVQIHPEISKSVSASCQIFAKQSQSINADDQIVVKKRSKSINTDEKIPTEKRDCNNADTRIPTENIKPINADDRISVEKCKSFSAYDHISLIGKSKPAKANGHTLAVMGNRSTSAVGISLEEKNRGRSFQAISNFINANKERTISQVPSYDTEIRSKEIQVTGQAAKAKNLLSGNRRNHTVPEVQTTRRKAPSEKINKYCEFNTVVAGNYKSNPLAKDCKTMSPFSNLRNRSKIEDMPKTQELQSLLGTLHGNSNYRQKTRQAEQIHKVNTNDTKNSFKGNMSGFHANRIRESKPKQEFLPWKPTIRKFPVRSGSYNCRRRYKYTHTRTESRCLDEILQFYDERVKVDIISKYDAQDYIHSILSIILNNETERDGLFAKFADEEGSLAAGLKVGKADESDHSVDILVNTEEIILSDEPFMVEFEDDIDSYMIDEMSSTFVNGGKRFFIDGERKLFNTETSLSIPAGFIAVRLGCGDRFKCSDSCISRYARDRPWLLPYLLLNHFHKFVGNAVQALHNVTLNKGVRGPAVSLTVLQDGGPNISVDITLKLTLPTETLSVSDFKWPRNDTRKWLSEEKIDQVTNTSLYLVPKGDKYWKISFANCECELLKDIDSNKTWRKGCLRIMKKKFMIWQSKSESGLKGLSSYLLKTTLLWLCEILPEDKFWYKEELANRCLNFLQEFANRLKKGRIGEYFNPSVNLLENKNQECIQELIEFVEDDISQYTCMSRRVASL